MPVYTLNPSNRRAAKSKASHSPSLRERVSLRRNSAQSADGSETYYPTSSSSSSSTQRSRAASSAASAVANAQARRYAAEASGYMGNPRVKTPTGMYVLALVHKGSDYAVKDATRADIKSGWAMTYEDALELGRERVAELRAQGFVNNLFDMSTYHEMKKRNPLSEDGAVVSNPRRGGGRAAQKAGLKKGQSLMSRAAAAYRAGEYASMQDALRGVARGGASRGGRKHNPLSEDGAVVSNPRRKGSKGKAKRSGGRTAAQSNAARAMKLFHSGKASSLAEAWDIIRSGR
jgi:hypothetical protein